MANYSTIQAAIDAGITNMTVLRNHSRNDDGTTTYATGIDWFKFNNVVVSNIYSSGNSWIGFGASSEQLKVNRRDCAVWYEYSETGTIGRCRFYKFRWRGYSYYSATDAASLQEFEFFLFDTGQILLRFFTVPTSNFNGTNALVCGSATTSYSATAGTPCEYTFTPSDASAGTGWSVGTDRPVTGYYKLSGNAIFTLANFAPSGGESLFWDAETPEDTSLQMYTKVNNGSWRQVSANAGAIQGLPSSGTCTLYIKAELATTDNTATPTLKSVSIRGSADNKILVLTPTLPSDLRGNVGNMSVSYDGLGGLQGRGGPSAAFVGTFTPSGMTYRPNPYVEEHIEVSASANVVLTAITYADTQATEHVEVSVAARVVLTDIHDL